MSAENRAEAVATNIELKTQETSPDLTEASQDRVEEQHKQDQSAAIDLKEDLNNKAKKVIDNA